MNRTAAPDLESARALVSNEALWPAVRTFLWDFTALAHPSRVAAAMDAAGVPQNLDRSALLESPGMKKLVLSKLGAEEFFHPFGKEDFSRLVLAGADKFLEIAAWTGCLAMQERLSRITVGAEVRALKAAVPGAYPAFIAYKPYFRKFAAKGFSIPGLEDMPMERRPAELGGALLAAAMSGVPECVLKRFALEFPPDGFDPSSARKPDPQDCTEEVREAVALLLKLKFPEVHKSCFS